MKALVPQAEAVGDLELPIRQHRRLDAVHGALLGQILFQRTLGMDDALAGGHPIDRARLDRLDVAQRVPMKDPSIEQVGDGGNTNVWMRSHLDTFARW